MKTREERLENAIQWLKDRGLYCLQVSVSRLDLRRTRRESSALPERFQQRKRKERIDV